MVHQITARDNIAESLIPIDLTAEYNCQFHAQKILGNGSCLFNAVSFALQGTELLANDLRRQCAEELKENAADYAEMFLVPLGDYEALTCLKMALGYDTADIRPSTESAEMAVRIESERLVEEKRLWSSLIHIPALATVVKKPIFSVYTDQVPFEFRPIFHKKFYPLHCETQFSSNDVLFILWSRDSTFSSGPFIPNHFVCLFRTVEGETIGQFDDSRDANRHQTPNPVVMTIQANEETCEEEKQEYKSDEMIAQRNERQSDDRRQSPNLPKVVLNTVHDEKDKGKKQEGTNSRVCCIL